MFKSKIHVKKHVKKSTVVEHHQSLRKRAGDKHVSLIDHVVVFSGPLIPLAVFVQAYNVWVLGKTDGLSIITWTIMLFASSTMAVYAVKHKTKPLMIVYLPLVIADALVVSGILFL